MMNKKFETAFYKENPRFEMKKEVIQGIEEALSEPGMNSILLKGLVQSGKTSIFNLLIARLFDKGFDGVIILTKNSLDLVKTTSKRIMQSFSSVEGSITTICINEKDSKLAKYQLKQKKLIVIKKDKSDLKKLIKFLEDNPILLNQKLLIVDDESDWGSNGYNKRAAEDEEYFKKICLGILKLRKKLEQSKYLSVTATPISLFFTNYWMIRPQKTFLLPPHSKYLGAEELFLADNKLMKKIRENFVENVEFNRMLEIKEFESVLQDLPMISEAVLQFIIGGLMLTEEKRYSMLVHIDTKRKGHEQQKVVLENLVSELYKQLTNDEGLVVTLLKKLYLNAIESLGYQKYTFEELKNLVQTALDEEVKITLMNSDNKTKVKLDRSGNIKNEVPFSIFIGAFAVDRGVTFNNMISFVFGRSPKVANLDSSLQQLRILGARAKEDLPVTRIYCTENQLEKWQEFTRIDCEFNKNLELLDKANALASKTPLGDQMSYLVPSTKMEGVRLCATQKIDGIIKSYGPYSRILPKGFLPKMESHKLVDLNKALINSYTEKYGVNYFAEDQYVEIQTQDAIELLLNSYTAISSDRVNLLHLLEQSLFFLEWLKKENGDKVMLYCKYNRKRKLKRSNGNDDDAPDSGVAGDFSYAKKIAKKHAVLMMLHQSGGESNGIPFFWPVLVLSGRLPYNMKTLK